MSSSKTLLFGTLLLLIATSTIFNDHPFPVANAEASETQEFIVGTAGNIDEAEDDALPVDTESIINSIEEEGNDNQDEEEEHEEEHDDDDDDDDDDDEKEVECKSHFNDTLITNCPSRNVYKIATLNASPQKCLHIESVDEIPPSEQISKCTNYQSWFDGTNGCSAYGRPGREDWCDTYGSIKYPSSPFTAKQACCTCGGGKMVKLRFKVGDDVRVGEIEELYDCTKLRVVQVNTNSQEFDYTLKVMKGCQPYGQKYVQGKGWMPRYGIDPGALLNGYEDPDIHHDMTVELRKCRKGIVPEQEFALKDHPKGHLAEVHSSDHSTVMEIKHLKTGVTLSLDNKDGSPLILQRSFSDDEVFENKKNYFFINDKSKLLIYGKFGSSEYSEAEWYFDKTGDSKETQFGMWTFLPVNTTNTTEVDQEKREGGRTSIVDEHAEWLLQMTQEIGIEYVVKNFAPWHILDVDRGASKAAVKLRFRELSRHFHPDKNKSEDAAKIFVSLQGAYEGLKNSNEEEKKDFLAAADSESQLFSHSKHVKELLPFHWKQIGEGENVRYVIHVNGSQNRTNGNVNMTESEQVSDDTNDEEKTKEKPQVQIWLLQLYSARCGMSRAVDGFLDLAANYLEKYENIKVGAYGCGLYDKDMTSQKDQLGVKTDPICKQFKRPETPNIHIVVETLTEGDDDEGSNMLALEANAKFDYFYAAVPTGNATQLHTGALINFAINGAKVWENYHLVKEMVRSDFTDPAFMKNTSIIAFIDENDKDNKEIQDALSNSLPALAGRFKGADLYVGVASCGTGEEEDEHFIDCSALNVSWLPDVKIFGPDQSEGLSLVRDEFTDRRDVQIGTYIEVLLVEYLYVMPVIPFL